MGVPRVVIDTNVFLSARDSDEPGYAVARELLAAVDQGKVHAIISVVTIAELRAGFEAPQVPALWTPFLSHLRASPSFTIESVDEAIALTAGELRSDTGLRLPDALILATALRRGADCVATEDQTLLRAHVPVVVKRPGEIPPRGAR